MFEWTATPLGALRREQTQSAAWRVQDGVAHMGSAYRALFGPAALELMRSNDIERTNDVFVDQRATIHLGSPAGTAAQIDSLAVEFPEWATQRTSWRDRTVSIAGETDYGARFLDAVNVV